MPLRNVLIDVAQFFVSGAAATALLTSGMKRWRDRRKAVMARRKKIDEILILHGVAETLQELPAAIKAIADQLTPHGGDSLIERVENIDRCVMLLGRRIDLSMSQLDMACATTDRAGGWTDTSRAMQRQTGRSAEELVGRGWYDAIYDVGDRGAVIERYERAVRDRREFDMMFSWNRGHGDLVLVRMIAWWVPQHELYVVNARRTEPAEG